MTDAGSAPQSWWRPWRIALALVLAAGVAGVAFLYRFNTLGGSLGFDNDHFAHLMRTEMLLYGEQPLRDFAEAELRGAWPALSYAVPAWAQRLGGRTLLPEAYLTIGALALAYALVSLSALGLSRRWLVAVLCAAVAVAATPKLYNYYKVLMFAFGGVALPLVASTRGVWPLLGAAAVTATAALFRHDYGAYLAVGILGGIVGASVESRSGIVRRSGSYLGLTALLLLPSALWVQYYVGIPTYLADAFESARAEVRRTSLELPSFDITRPFAPDGLLAVSYAAFWALIAVAATVLAWRMLDGRASRPTPTERASGMGLLAMTVMATVFLLRSNLAQRFGDAVVPAVLLAAWTVGVAPMLTGRRRDLASIAPVGLLVLMLVAALAYGDMARQVQAAGFTESWETVQRRFAATRADLLALPPESWAGVDADGPLVAARYLAECTTPEDYVLVAGYAPELSVFARRRFAAGQGTMSLSLYLDEDHQRRALERLERQSVPIVLADAATFSDEFVHDYPLLARYLAANYREAGTIAVDDDRQFRVLVDGRRTPSRRDPHFGLPCFR